ncbi:MAG: DUF4465 domain-containing protein [Phycisphaerae bacterium]|nr:DUF4465 domain-containing protein [Phycisphaerae bacterium]
MQVRRMVQFCLSAAVSLVFPAMPAAAAVADFEEFGQPPYSLGSESFYNGSDDAGGFYSGGAFFNNSYTDYGGELYSWSGWSASNMTDTTTPGYDNQYSAYTGVGGDGSEFYALSYTFYPGDTYIELPAEAVIESMQIANTTYAALSMLNGDYYSKQFGGLTGDDPDWFKLIITGLDENDAQVGQVEFYLADYRFADNDLDYVVDEWVSVGLASVSTARKLSFALESSDVGPWGMNTPAYFAMDNLTFVPEPGSMLLLLLGGALWRRR